MKIDLPKTAKMKGCQKIALCPQRMGKLLALRFQVALCWTLMGSGQIETSEHEPCVMCHCRLQRRLPRWLCDRTDRRGVCDDIYALATEMVRLA